MQSAQATQPNPSELTIQETAETFVGRLMDEKPIGLNTLHTLTMSHLVQRLSLPYERAKWEAAKAVGAMNARATNARFDVTKSTNTCIFIKDESGRTHAITVPEALALCKVQDHIPTT